MQDLPADCTPLPPDASPGTPVTDGRALSDDEFAALAEACLPELLAVARRSSRDRSAAEDAAQETVYRAYRNLSGFRRGSNFRGWMFRILRNVLINRSRLASARTALLDPEEFDPPAARDTETPDVAALADLAALSDRHFDDRMKRSLASLPGTYREPFLLSVLGELSYAEIAVTLGIPEGTVMSRIHRARHRLRNLLSGDSPGAPAEDHP